MRETENNTNSSRSNSSSNSKENNRWTDRWKLYSINENNNKIINIISSSHLLHMLIFGLLAMGSLIGTKAERYSINPSETIKSISKLANDLPPEPAQPPLEPQQSQGNTNTNLNTNTYSNEDGVDNGNGNGNGDIYIASLVNSHHHHAVGGYGREFSNALDEPDENIAGDETTEPPPVFDFGMPRNITARTGHTAAINCRVDNLGDKSVSWIRKRDLHILTAGILTYTSDERFKVVRTADSKDWTLHVKYAQPRDSGIYECQVNTEPKISMAFRLNVIVTPPDAKAIIAGPTDLYVKVGSIITLTCHVKQPTTPSAQDIGPIYWYRGPYILTPFVAHPNDAAIDLQRISMESTLAEKLQSRLRIANAQLLDTGNYTCMPTTAEAASVMVNVINDESPAAMQKSGASALSLNWWSIFGTLAIGGGSSTLDIQTVVRWIHIIFVHIHINYCRSSASATAVAASSLS